MPITGWILKKRCMKGHGNHKSTNFKLKRFIHERERTLNKTKKYIVISQLPTLMEMKIACSYSIIDYSSEVNGILLICGQHQLLLCDELYLNAINHI